MFSDLDQKFRKVQNGLAGYQSRIHKFFEPSLKKSERPMNWLHRYSIIVTHIYIDSINLMWKIEYSISVRLISIRHS